MMREALMTNRKNKRHSRRAVCAARAILIIAVLFAAQSAMAAAAQSARRAIVNEINGPAEMRSPGGVWTPVAEGAVLHELDELRTGDGTEASLLLDDGGATGIMQVAANTHVRFRQLAWDEITESRETLIDVALGRINLFVNKLTKKSKFEVYTPTATIGVRGTVFEVDVSRRESES